MSVISIKGLQAGRSQNFCLEIKQLQVSAGTVLCVTGPNGSGKTTLIDCIAGLLRPTRGSVLVNHIPVNDNLRQTKAGLGFVPDDDTWLIKELCAQEYFSLLAQVYRQADVQEDMTKRIDELSHALHFNSFRSPLGSLSHGNKKKVQIIAGLMHQPKVILMDEVRNGLDPLAVIAVERLILAEAKRGAAIVATTHDLWWAERLAGKVLILVDGKVKTHQKTADIIAQSGSVEAHFLNVLGET